MIVIGVARPIPAELRQRALKVNEAKIALRIWDICSLLMRDAGVTSSPMGVPLSFSLNTRTDSFRDETKRDGTRGMPARNSEFPD